MNKIEGYCIQNGEPTPDNPAEIRSLDIEDIKFIDEMVKEYNTFGDLDNPDYEDTDRIYKAIENILLERKQDKARIQELQDMLKEKDKEIEKKDKIIEQINKDIEANIYLAESNYNVEELNDYARGVCDTYINMRMQYFERKAKDGRMIEVGEYVRTKDGVIDKVQNYSYSQNIWHCENGMCIDECNCIGTHLEDIVKHSKIISEVVEIGDYVNGERILDITGDYIHTNETDHNKFYLEKHIKTILTKEQYIQNCYKIDTN